MADFRRALEEVGGRNVSTVGASGNAVLETSEPRSREALERAVEEAVSRRQGLSVVAFARSSADWEDIARTNPFREEAARDPAHLLVLVLSDPAKAGRWAALQNAIVGRERIAPGERHGYVVYPDGIGRSKLTLEVIERHLGVRATGRNWNTVLRLRRPAGTNL